MFDMDSALKPQSANQRIIDLEFDIEKVKLDNEALESKLKIEKNLTKMITKMYHNVNGPKPETADAGT